VPIQQHGLFHKVHWLRCNHCLVQLPSIAVMSQRHRCCAKIQVFWGCYTMSTGQTKPGYLSFQVHHCEDLGHHMGAISIQTSAFPHQQYIWLIFHSIFPINKTYGKIMSILTGYLQWNNSFNCENLISKFVNIYIYINYNITELFSFCMHSHARSIEYTP
jgi:hypothetical protein